jgi:hypothetical protein
VSVKRGETTDGRRRVGCELGLVGLHVVRSNRVISLILFVLEVVSMTPGSLPLASHSCCRPSHPISFPPSASNRSSESLLGKLRLITLDGPISLFARGGVTTRGVLLVLGKKRRKGSGRRARCCGGEGFPCCVPLVHHLKQPMAQYSHCLSSSVDPCCLLEEACSSH